MATEDYLCDDCGTGLFDKCEDTCSHEIERKARQKEVSDDIKTHYYALDVLAARYEHEFNVIKDEVRDDIASGKLSVNSTIGSNHALMKLVMS